MRKARSHFGLAGSGATTENRSRSQTEDATAIAPSIDAAHLQPSSLSHLQLSMQAVRSTLLDVLWEVEQVEETLDIRLNAAVKGDPGAGAMVAGFKGSGTPKAGSRRTDRGWSSVRIYACRRVCMVVNRCLTGASRQQDSERFVEIDGRPRSSSGGRYLIPPDVRAPAFAARLACTQLLECARQPLSAMRGHTPRRYRVPSSKSMRPSDGGDQYDSASSGGVRVSTVSATQLASNAGVTGGSDSGDGSDSDTIDGSGVVMWDAVLEATRQVALLMAEDRATALQVLRCDVLAVYTLWWWVVPHLRWCLSLLVLYLVVS